MSNKWKYAAMPAEERLALIRGGNSDVYDSEAERVKSVISDRMSLGLDISEQLKWADDIGYNYALSQAHGVGVKPEHVEKSGYGARLLGEINGISPTEALSGAAVSSAAESKGTGDGARFARVTAEIAHENYADNAKKAYSQSEESYMTQLAAKNAQTDALYDELNAKLEAAATQNKKTAYNEALAMLPVLRERYANLGLSAEGGKVRSEELKFNAALDSLLAGIDGTLAQEKNENLSAAAARKLSDLGDTVEALREESRYLDSLYYSRMKDDRDYADKLAERAAAAESEAYERDMAEKDREFKASAQTFEQQYKLAQQEAELALKSEAQSFSNWLEEQKLSETMSQNDIENALKQSELDLDYISTLATLALKYKQGGDTAGSTGSSGSPAKAVPKTTVDKSGNVSVKSYTGNSLDSLRFFIKNSSAMTASELEEFIAKSNTDYFYDMYGTAEKALAKQKAADQPQTPTIASISDSLLAAARKIK